jgi:Capsular polysaccharide biosynthesis protein
MMDIHTHILPGVDDGAGTIEVTSAMLAIALNDGITDMVATPHADLRYKFDFDHCRQELARVRSFCPQAPRLHLGCELHLTPENLDQAVRRPESFTLNGKGCVLLELADGLRPAAVDSAVHLLVEAGLRPIIAHPERNAYIQKNLSYAASLVAAGCYLQLTAQSLGGSFGHSAREASSHILKRQLAHFVASDAHGSEHRRPLLASAHADVSRHYGKAAAHMLFVDNPRAAISGSVIQTVLARRRSLFTFFARSSQSQTASLVR